MILLSFKSKDIASKAALNGFCASVNEDIREHNIKITHLVKRKDLKKKIKISTFLKKVLGLVKTPLGTRPMGKFQRKLSPDEMIQPEECGDQLMFAVNADESTVVSRICSESVHALATWHVDPSRLPPGKDDRQLRAKL